VGSRRVQLFACLRVRTQKRTEVKSTVSRRSSSWVGLRLLSGGTLGLGGDAYYQYILTLRSTRRRVKKCKSFQHSLLAIGELDANAKALPASFFPVVRSRSLLCRPSLVRAAGQAHACGWQDTCTVLWCMADDLCGSQGSRDQGRGFAGLGGRGSFTHKSLISNVFAPLPTIYEPFIRDLWPFVSNDLVLIDSRQRFRRWDRRLEAE